MEPRPSAMTLELRFEIGHLAQDLTGIGGQKSLHCLSAHHSVAQVWFDLVVLLLTRGSKWTLRHFSDDVLIGRCSVVCFESGSSQFPSSWTEQVQGHIAGRRETPQLLGRVFFQAWKRVTDGRIIEIPKVHTKIWSGLVDDLWSMSLFE